MEKARKTRSIRSVAGFILFSLLFFAVCIGICLLWSIFGKTAGGSSEVSDNTRVCVVIDAGHGGADGGAVGSSGIVEKDLNLDIAKKLRDVLVLCGTDVIMTRDGDIMLEGETGTTKKARDLNARLNIARNTGNAVFVSIHMNSFPVEKYSGLQVYYSSNNEKSYALASLIQDRVREFIQKDNDRKIKAATDSIFLLDRLTCPAVLVECGFISNRNEALLLGSEEYRNKLVFILCCAVNEYIYVCGS